MTKAAELFLEELKERDLKHMDVREVDDVTIIPLGFQNYPDRRPERIQSYKQRFPRRIQMCPCCRRC